MSKFEPIAIIAQGCVLPGCHSAEELGNTIEHGRIHISDKIGSDWRVKLDRILATNEHDIAGKTLTLNGGYVTGYDSIITDDLKLQPQVLKHLDRLFLWCFDAAQQALKSTNYYANAAIKKRTGIILGNLSYPSAKLTQLYEAILLKKLVPNDVAGLTNNNPLNRFMSGLPAILTAQALGLGGDAFCLDAACASSLYAIKLACDQLQTREADLMLAGGVCASDALFIHIGFTALKAISLTGQSRPFSLHANGLVPAEGVGMLLLKRLDDAIKAEDRILGVIRGIGLSNDGRSKGLLSPSSEGQIRCMQQAFIEAEIEPANISYIECHATGTPIGDQTELSSMLEFYGSNKKIAIGSLKANLGHLITASGAAGVIKVLQSMQRNIQPLTPNAFPLNNFFRETPFTVLEKTQSWTEPKERRFAALSNFGFGGCNAHLILQAWDENKSKIELRQKKQPVIPMIEQVAIVGLGIHTEKAADIKTFIAQLMQTDHNNTALLDSIELSLEKLNFPPNDLKETLAQQNILLNVVSQAVAKTKKIEKDAGVYIGMEVDPEICRYGLRWRLEEYLTNHTFSTDWLNSAKTAINAELTAAGVIGKMPNMPASRINYQYNFGGAGFTLSAEELSGNKALKIALSAIKRGEVKAAIVGAVELAKDAIHREALMTLDTNPANVASAAIVFVLKPLKTAIEDQEEIIAVLETSQQSDETLKPIATNWIEEKIGYAHAAQGMLHLLTGVIGAAQHCKFNSAGEMISVIPASKKTQFKISTQSDFGIKDSIIISNYRDESSVSFTLMDIPKLYLFAAPDRSQLLANLKHFKYGGQGNHRLAIVAKENEIASKVTEAIKYLESWTEKLSLESKGIFYIDKPIKGEIGFVYTGAAASYPNMGKNLLLTFPRLMDGILKNIANPRELCEWVYESGPDAKLPFNQLAATSLFCQLHSELSFKLLGIKPDAVLGMSSGETNAMFATGVWSNIAELFDAINESELYATALANQFDSIRQYWEEPSNYTVNWENWQLFAPVSIVQNLLKKENRVYLTIINTDNNCIIGGESAACQRLLKRLPADCKWLPFKHDLAIHCPAVKPFAETWRQLHTRPTKNVQDIRFYSNYFGDSYVPNKAQVAEALTGQAIETIDFRKIINKAWDDGVRIFVEHGPKDSLTQAIQEILGDKPHLAVALDTTKMDPVLQFYNTMAQLWCNNCIDLAAMDKNFKQQVIVDQPILGTTKMLTIELPMHMPEIKFPKTATPANISCAKQIENHVPITPQSNSVNQVILNHYSQVTELYRLHLNTQTVAQRNFLKFIDNLQRSLNFMPRSLRKTPQSNTKLLEANPTFKQYPGPKYNRAQLEFLAAEKISKIFGELFVQQDQYAVQCRMPEPPLLLCDRVLGIAGEPGSLAKGTIWTETDIKTDSWYLHHGRMPAGIFIESGQADLLLISWLGIDFENKGERAYRLLGCELEFHGGLPKVGETLHYQIQIDGYAQQGDIRLFFFHYDCTVNGELRLSVRNGQAGFFSKKELANSLGVIWDPSTANYTTDANFVTPPNPTAKIEFTAAEIKAFTAGDLVSCFGQSFGWTQTHIQTPNIQSGSMCFIEKITDYQINGGPAKRGYMRAESTVQPQDWYFNGHFKNDPCMPGTLMAEACLQMLAFYCASLGYTLEKDGWRFEPVMQEKFKFICRGQVTPKSKNLIYELFVDEIIVAAGIPTLFAHVLCTVDGTKAFLCERLGIRLVPDWPLESNYDLLAEIRAKDAVDQRPVAQLKGFHFNYESLLNCAWGKPSNAFSKDFNRFDGVLRSPRLPGLPYHFMTRVTELQGESGKPIAKSYVVVDYDIPADAWFFLENSSAIMPYAVLMEVALQPCGWLSSFTLEDTGILSELLYRNLDGLATQYRQITPADAVITTRSTLISTAKMGDTIIQKFQVECFCGEEKVYSLSTAFGFFPKDVFKQQKGLTSKTSELERINADNNLNIQLTNFPNAYFGQGIASLPASKLLMLDCIDYFDKLGGKHQQGYIRAKRAIAVTDWYFKAHFFQDPVQPGSLGIEAMLQLLQFYILENGYHQQIKNPSFEIGLKTEIEWHYRGQVVPSDKFILIEADIISCVVEEGCCKVLAEATLWVNGLKIYSAPKLAVVVKETAIGNKQVATAYNTMKELS